MELQEGTPDHVFAVDPTQWLDAWYCIAKQLPKVYYEVKVKGLVNRQNMTLHDTLKTKSEDVGDHLTVVLKRKLPTTAYYRSQKDQAKDRSVCLRF
jgi:hypothetical protein